MPVKVNQLEYPVLRNPLKLIRDAGFLLAFCLILLSAHIPLTAQNRSNIKFERLSTENFKIERGLSQNSVRCIWQDHRGFMWFGTWDGLNKYDGYGFRVYKSAGDLSGNFISNQTVNTIFEDSRNNLWIGTETGLNLFDRKSQKFRQLWHVKENRTTISSDSVLCITEDGMGNIWIGTRNGLNKYDPKTGLFRRFFLDPDNANSLSSNNILCLSTDKKGNLFVGTDKGLNILNLKTGIVTHIYAVSGDALSLSDDHVNCLTLDDSGRLWIGTDNGLAVLNYRQMRIRHYLNNPRDPNSLSNNQVFALLKDHRSNMWVGTNGGGLNLYDPSIAGFIRYQNSSNDNYSISNDYISSLYQDRSGIIWVGTAWKGVNKINENLEKFDHFEHIKDDPNSLNNNIVWSLFQVPDGRLVVGTEEGINIIDRETGTNLIVKKEDGKQNTLSSNQVRRVFKDSRGNYWVGTFGSGLDQYNMETGRFRHFNHDPLNPKSLSNNTVWCITEDKSGYIWIGTDDGLNRYDYATASFTVFKHTPNYRYSISDNAILSLYIDRGGFLWACTYKGLNVYDPKTGRFFHYRHDPDNPNSLSSDFVFSVYEARDGTLWIATMGGGLNRYNRNTGMFWAYTEKDGLANNVVYDIFEDRRGMLWISTNYGLSRFDPLNEDFVNYDVKDGIQSNEFNLGAAYHNPITDEMFFGGMNGFNAFFPEKVMSNKYIPPVVISGFRIFDKEQQIEISNNDTINLSYYDNFFSFEFSALDYTNPSKNHYAFMMENFDKDWNYTDAYKRFAGYTNVPPGTYTFKVKGSNSDGVWNEEGVEVVIIISPAWWATWWFRIPAILIIVFVMWYIIYMRWRNIRIKHEDEKRILEIEKQMFSLEQTALRLQINPHFIFNSLNSIQSFVISNDTDKAINYLAKFAQLMRLILSNSHQAFIPITDELKALNIYLDIERLRFNNKFDYEFVIDPLIDTDFMEIPPMIVQPYIENAILHGILNKKERGRILIEMRLSGNALLCIVEDDGIGREKAAEIKARSDLHHKSRGMLITQKRLELLNKQNKEQMSVTIIDLKDQQGKACGTRVEIMIMYQES